MLHLFQCRKEEIWKEIFLVSWSLQIWYKLSVLRISCRKGRDWEKSIQMSLMRHAFGFGMWIPIQFLFWCLNRNKWDSRTQNIVCEHEGNMVGLWCWADPQGTYLSIIFQNGSLLSREYNAHHGTTHLYTRHIEHKIKSIWFIIQQPFALYCPQLIVHTHTADGDLLMTSSMSILIILIL